MQKSKTRTGSSAMSQKTSPVTQSSRQSKVSVPDEPKVKSPSVSVPTLSRSPKTKSPKPIEKKASRSPVSEKKPVSRVSKLESQLTQVQEDLKKTKELLNSSESSKIQALEEAIEAKKQYFAMAADFEDTKRQLLELSRSDVDQSTDKTDDEKVESKNIDHAIREIENLKVPETELAVESDSQVLAKESSEADYQERINESQILLQVANSTIQSLHSDGLKVVAAFKVISSELEASKGQVSSLENAASALRSEVIHLKSAVEESEIKLKEEQIKNTVQMSSSEETVKALRQELETVKSSALESTLDANARISELKTNLDGKKEELAESLVVIEALKREIEKSKASDDEVAEMKSNLALLKAELTDRETELQKAKSTQAEVDELKLSLSEKDGHLKELITAHETLTEEIKKLAENQLTAELKENLMDKETELQSVSEENKVLKMELQKMKEEIELTRESALAELEATKSSQVEKAHELEQAAEKAEKSEQKANKLAEQLESTRAANSEMEAELKRLRIQTEQWRKAAEAAAAILNASSNGKVSEKSGPIEGGEYGNFGGKVLSSPYSDEMDEESAAKTKKNNVLKKFGGLWKKGQK